MVRWVVCFLERCELKEEDGVKKEGGDGDENKIAFVVEVVEEDCEDEKDEKGEGEKDERGERDEKDGEKGRGRMGDEAFWQGDGECIEKVEVVHVGEDVHEDERLACCAGYACVAFACA